MSIVGQVSKRAAGSAHSAPSLLGALKGRGVLGQYTKNTLFNDPGAMAKTLGSGGTIGGHLAGRRGNSLFGDPIAMAKTLGGGGTIGGHLAGRRGNSLFGDSAAVAKTLSGGGSIRSHLGGRAGNQVAARKGNRIAQQIAKHRTGLALGAVGATGAYAVSQRHGKAVSPSGYNQARGIRNY